MKILLEKPKQKERIFYTFHFLDRTTHCCEVKYVDLINSDFIIFHENYEKIISPTSQLNYISIEHYSLKDKKIKYEN